MTTSSDSCGSSDRPLDLPTFARLVKFMRAKQTTYFRTFNKTVLCECKDLERRVDARIKAILDPPLRDMFESDQAGA